MSLRIVIVSDSSSWMRPYCLELVRLWSADSHDVSLTETTAYDTADIVFFLSYSKIVSGEILGRSRTNIVVHGSALPEGRGWSPWSWQILNSQNRLALTLFEACEDVDSGPIYDQRWVELQGHELVDEWQAIQAQTTLAMCMDFVRDFPEVLKRARPQLGTPMSYPRRHPCDSRLDPNLSIAEQFGLLRIVDNQRYPAYFDLAGHTYEMTIRKRNAS